MVPFIGLLAAASRYRPERKDFGGRYSDFGFLLALLNRAPTRGDAEPAPPSPGGCTRDDDAGSSAAS
jgi:hypothetical protein